MKRIFILMFFSHLVLNCSQANSPEIFVKVVLSKEARIKNGIQRFSRIKAHMIIDGKTLFIAQKQRKNKESGEERLKFKYDSAFYANEKHAHENEVHYKRLQECLNKAEEDAINIGQPANYFYKDSLSHGFSVLGYQGVADNSPITN